MVNCQSCEVDKLSLGVGFADFVTDPLAADIVVDIRVEPAEQNAAWQFAFSGRGPFLGENRTIEILMPAAASPDELEAEISRILRIGVAEYAAATDSGPQLSVIEEAHPAPPPSVAQRDPWNAWMFTLGFDGLWTGESLTSEADYSVSASANRVTEEWKIRVSTNRNLRSSSFVIDEESMETVKSRRSDWNVNALVVRSAGGRWSFGVLGALVGSTFTNQDRSESLAPAVEFDVFPYRESSKRSLTIQYAAGATHFRYLEQTVFGKFRETAPLQVVNVSFGMSQPWGQAGGSLKASQRLDAADMNRVTGTGNLTLRISRGFSLIVSTSASRIRDQFYLPRGAATEEQVLLRLRQLATGHSYSTSVSFSYSFGSLANRTVNPRFSG